jgi:CubicO group peptidase (beta-lactamase class C family)
MDVEEALGVALRRGEIGVQVAAYAGDELVVDSWAGTVAEGPDAEPVGRSTVFPIFSVTKAVTATAVHIQAERGLIEYEAPVATYWPEYGTKGKEAITVRHLLTHRAGVPQMPSDVTPERLGDWYWIVERLADVEPICPPGTQNTYLSYTFGWLLGEVVRRTDPLHRPFPRFVEEVICRPLGVDAFWIGIPPEVEPRVAVLSRPEGKPMPAPDSVEYLAAPPQVQFYPPIYNRPDVHQAAIPAAGGIADARSVARLFALLANRGELGGVRLLSEERVLSFLEPRPDTNAYDPTHNGPGNAIGIGGYHLNRFLNLEASARGPISPGGLSRRVLCHAGSGGSIGWADVDARVSMAICHNRQFNDMSTPVLTPLGDATYEAAVAVRAAAEHAYPMSKSRRDHALDVGDARRASVEGPVPRGLTENKGVRG